MELFLMLIGLPAAACSFLWFTTWAERRVVNIPATPAAVQAAGFPTSGSGDTAIDLERRRHGYPTS